jgi:hypothetical protein
MNKLKMHIVIRPDISIEAAIIAVSHASLGTYLTFEKDEVMQNWKNNSFVKIIHKAINREQFISCRNIGPHRVFTESTLDNLEVSVGFKPMIIDSYKFKDIPLWIL